jgi:hypothetical protein
MAYGTWKHESFLQGLPTTVDDYRRYVETCLRLNPDPPPPPPNAKAKK